MTRNTPAPARAAAADEAASATAERRVKYRILPKGAGLIYTGEHDRDTGAALTFERGAVVESDPSLAAVLEDRGLVEVLDPA